MVVEKMIHLCSGENSKYSGSSKGSDLIMTSNCINDIIFFSSALLKTQMTLSEKTISFSTFYVLHFKAIRLQNMSNKESLKNNYKKNESGGKMGCFVVLQIGCFLAKLKS